MAYCRKLSELILELRSPYYTLDQAVGILSQKYNFSDSQKVKEHLRRYRSTYSGLEKTTKELLNLLDSSNLDFETFCSLIEYETFLGPKLLHSFSNNIKLVLNDINLEQFEHTISIPLNTYTNDVLKDIYIYLFYLEVILNEPVFLTSDLSFMYINHALHQIQEYKDKIKTMFNITYFNSIFYHYGNNLEVSNQIGRFKDNHGLTNPLILDYKTNNYYLYNNIGIKRLIRLTHN